MAGERRRDGVHLRPVARPRRALRRRRARSADDPPRARAARGRHGHSDRDREALAARRLHRLPAVPGEGAGRGRGSASRHPERRGAAAAAAGAVVTVVGQRVRAIGWDARTSGTDAYSADLPFTDVLIGRVLRSPHPYAEILSIDTSRAANMPGVRAVITAADFPKGARYIHSGGETSDRGPLADG